MTRTAPFRFALLLLTAAAAGAAHAKAGSGNPGQEPQPPIIAPVFVYVYEPGPTNPTGQPLQELREARITVSGPRAAYDIKTLGDNKGDGSPETFHAVAASAVNRLAVAYSIQLPAGAIDHDLRVYDLSQHKLILFFNEHSLVSQIHRSTCHSAQLDALIASEAAMGVPQSQLAAYDFKISVDGPDAANVPQIQLVEWATGNTLHLTWPQHILMGPSGSFITQATETFDLLIRVTSAGAPALVGCTPPASLTQPPRAIHAISPSGTGPAGLVKIDGATLNFRLLSKLPPPGPPKRINARTADMAAGAIATTGPYATP